MKDSMGREKGTAFGESLSPPFLSRKEKKGERKYGEQVLRL